MYATVEGQTNCPSSTPIIMGEKLTRHFFAAATKLTNEATSLRIMHPSGTPRLPLVAYFLSR